MGITTSRAYDPDDHEACLTLFDQNCPDYFAPSERQDYQTFLENGPLGYRVCLHQNQIVGAWGLAVDRASHQGRLQWILLARRIKGLGVGRDMMSHSLQQARALDLNEIHIAASQKSAPFFSRFGAQPMSTTADGWGPGLDRIDMVIDLINTA